MVILQIKAFNYIGKIRRLKSTLQQKVNQTKTVIEDAFGTIPSDDTIVAWSAGEDSMLMPRHILVVPSTKDKLNAL